MNLNESEIYVRAGDNIRLLDNGYESPVVSVYFRDLENVLLRHVKHADAVLGCVAWLTNDRILAALAGVPHGVSIIVQKEDFLRPDAGPKRGQDKRLRKKYDAIPPILTIGDFYFDNENVWGFSVGSLTGSTEETMDSWQPFAPIRCAGVHNVNKSLACPRMHNKFLILCRKAEPGETPLFRCENEPGMVISKIWTGSFNMSYNATMSLENAVVLNAEEDKRIGYAYYREWSQIFAISESLDWTKPWVQTEWWVGS